MDNLLVRRSCCLHHCLRKSWVRVYSLIISWPVVPSLRTATNSATISVTFAPIIRPPRSSPYLASKSASRIRPYVQLRLLFPTQRMGSCPLLRRLRLLQLLRHTIDATLVSSKCNQNVAVVKCFWRFSSDFLNTNYSFSRCNVSKSCSRNTIANSIIIRCSLRRNRQR